MFYLFFGGESQKNCPLLILLSHSDPAFPAVPPLPGTRPRPEGGSRTRTTAWCPWRCPRSTSRGTRRSGSAGGGRADPPSRSDFGSIVSEGRISSESSNDPWPLEWSQNAIVGRRRAGCEGHRHRNPPVQNKGSVIELIARL